MKKFVLFLLACFCLTSVAANAQEAESAKEMILVADEWCPYNCAPDSAKPGFIIEIAKAIFEPKGIKVTYEVMPWERAIEDTRKGTYTGILAALVSDAPDFVIPEEPIGYSSNTFFVKTGSSWKYEDVSSLKNVSVGVIEGYTYGPGLDSYLTENKGDSSKVQSIAGDSALSQNFMKLEKGRIDTYIEDMNVAMQYIADNSKWGKFKPAGSDIGPASQHFVYISFSPVNKDSAEYASILSVGIKELRKSGKLKEILDKYNVTDWADKK